MKRAVIDTHALVWYLAKPKRVGKRAMALLRDAERGKARVLVPSPVLVELALLGERGRKILGVAEALAALAQSEGLVLAPFGLAEARESSLLSAIADPFDPMMVATARAAECPLLSGDQAITETGLVPVVWDE
ncbi:MAG: PIN domain-containing protein [Polyangiaceae bacterium]|nr:PIN domain-containing protein [Polyangiaceae bacterium]